MGNNHYMIIDDSQIDIFIASKMLQAVTPGAQIKSFLNAAEALEFIRNTPADAPKTVLFVDISMPIMDGFQFMHEFEKLPASVQDHYFTCFLTSSINEGDISKAKSFKSIRSYMNKPLTHNSIQQLLSSID